MNCIVIDQLAFFKTVLEKQAALDSTSADGLRALEEYFYDKDTSYDNSNLCNAKPVSACSNEEACDCQFCDECASFSGDNSMALCKRRLG